MSEWKQPFRQLQRSVGNMLARCIVSAVTASAKCQGLQVRLLAGETKDNVEHFEPYGITSHPFAGAEGVAMFFDGDRSHGVVVCVGDRRYRLKNLAAGEVALYDDQGQKIHLTRSGIVIDGGGKPVNVTNAPSVTIESPVVTMNSTTVNLNASSKVAVQTSILDVTGDVKDRNTSDGTTMKQIRDRVAALETAVGGLAGVRSAYNSHTHTENGAGLQTGGPSTGM